MTTVKNIPMSKILMPFQYLISTVAIYLLFFQSDIMSSLEVTDLTTPFKAFSPFRPKTTEDFTLVEEPEEEEVELDGFRIHAQSIPMRVIDDSPFPWQGGRPTVNPLIRGMVYISLVTIPGRPRISKSFPFTESTKEEAFQNAKTWIETKSRENGLLKNCWRETLNKDVIEMQLDKKMGVQMITKIDREDLEKTLGRTWVSHRNTKSNKFFAAAGRLKLHTHLTKFIITQHLDDDLMNNCKANLCEGSTKVIGGVRKLSKKSQTGVNGIFLPGSKDRYVATWREGSKGKSKNFLWKKYGGDAPALEAARQFLEAVNAKEEQNVGMQQNVLMLE